MQRKFSEYHKRQIAGAMCPLRHGVSIAQALAAIESATKKFWRAADNESRFESIDLDQNALIVMRGKLPPHRPRRDSMRRYVRALVTIYEGTTGRPIRRNVDPYVSQRRENGKIPHGDKFHPFILTCAHAAGTRYSRKILTEILHELHSNAKRGRPKAASQ